MSHDHCLPIWHTKALKFGNIFARGLTSTIQTDFAPEFSSCFAMKSVGSGGRKRTRGRARGNALDRSVQKWVTEGKVPKNNPYMTSLAAEISRRGWLPVSAQATAGCQELRLATKVDLICTNEKQQIILIEIKTGYAYYFDVHNQGCFRFPFDSISMSCRNLAFLQLLFTTYLYLHARPNIAYGGSYLIHLFEEDQCQCVPLPTFFFSDPEVLPTALECMRRSKNKNKRTRQCELTNGKRRKKRCV